MDGKDSCYSLLLNNFCFIELAIFLVANKLPNFFLRIRQTAIQMD